MPASPLRPPSAQVLDALEHHQAGRLREAHRLYQQALVENPEDFHAHHFMGVLMHQGGHSEPARQHLEQATRLQPGEADPWVNLALVLKDQAAFEAAAIALETALQLDPGLDVAWSNLGNLHQELGHFEQALGEYDQAISLNPEDASLHYNRATLLARMGKTRASMEACERSIALQPDSGDVYGQLADNHLVLNQPGRAMNAANSGLKHQPRHAGLLYTLGFAQATLGDLAAARNSYLAALEVEPEHGGALSALIYTKRQLADWQGMERLVQRFVAGIDRGQQDLTPFCFLAENSSRAQQKACARLWTKNLQSQTPASQEQQPREPGTGKLTIGYLSADYYRHPTAYLAAGLFEAHDRDRFRIIGYSNSRDDGSAIRQRVVSAFDEFVDIRELSVAAAADRIRADGVDILVDLKGHTLEAATGIMAQRPAPIQVQYLGYPGTMGAGFIDYLIGDAVVTPFEHQPDYDEYIVQLPGSYQINDRQRPCPPPVQSREQLGLPGEGTVFCCFNAGWKLTARTFDTWASILAATAGSVLWLLGEPDSDTADNLRREAELRAIHPARLVFAKPRPLEDYLALYHHADLFLDTLPYNAHTTASDALWMACPVISQPGETFASRVGASLLQAAGLPELITDSERSFVELATRLAADPVSLGNYQDQLTLLRDSAALFDTARTTRDIESAYLGMLERHLAGKPEPFAVQGRDGHEVVS
jgi:predicted O-linked N-acetylglucosamine transferase (SPINDLY family)